MRNALTIGYVCGALMLALACTLLSGCGQKGPLYLPDKKADAHIDGVLMADR